MKRQLTHPGTWAELAVLLCLAGGCLTTAGDPGTGPQPAPLDENIAGAPAELPVDPDSAFTAELGIVDPVTGLDFLPLPEGAPIPIAGTGQAGLTARLAVKLSAQDGVAIPADVLIDVMLIELATGETAQNRANVPLRLTCRADGACYRVPMLIEVSHLGGEGSEVEGSLTVRDVEDPARVLARASCTGTLERR